MVKFLREHNMETYIELTNIYSEIMDTVYYGHLRQYYNDTAKLIQKVQKGSELLFSDKVGINSRDSMGGSNPSMNKSNNAPELSESMISTTTREKAQHDVEDRSAILNKLDTQPIVVAIS